ncbi:hypothetical protein GF337_06140 [candidate division KSB1 bacterium]|nr:hypothetical protein [candidate division KSB1 bacterium]
MEKQVTLLIDGHIHIYPHYKLTLAIKNGISNLYKSAKESDSFDNSQKQIPVWMLVERYDCNFFDQIVNETSLSINGYTLQAAGDGTTIIVMEKNEPVLYIFAGRQLVTKENLEILSLISPFNLNDREYSIEEVIEKVNENGGVPALNWAPGKWFFSRGEIVKTVLNKYSPDRLLIGDTSLRTEIWSMPRLMSQARDRNYKIVAGSDPLPFEDEEHQIGKYGFAVSASFDEAKPAESMRNILRDTKLPFNFIGNRNSLFTFSRRQFKIMTA